MKMIGKITSSTIAVILLIPFIASAFTLESTAWETADASFVAVGGTNTTVFVMTSNSTIDNCDATYGGNAMTFEGGVYLTGADQYYNLFSYQDGASGSNAIDITCTELYGYEVHEYNGSLGTKNYNENTNEGASISLVLTTGYDTDHAISWASGRFGPHALTAETGVTNDTSVVDSLSGSGNSTGDATSLTHTWDNANSSNNAVLGIVLEEGTESTGGSTTTETTITGSTTPEQITALSIYTILLLLSGALGFILSIWIFQHYILS